MQLLSYYLKKIITKENAHKEISNLNNRHLGLNSITGLFLYYEKLMKLPVLALSHQQTLFSCSRGTPKK